MTGRFALVLLFLLLVLPEVVGAQLLPPGSRPRRQAPQVDRGGVAAMVVGRAGYDLQFQQFVLGGLGRVTLPMALNPTIQAGADFTFFQALTDRGATIDLMISPLQGLLVGGGPAWRNTVFPGEIGGIGAGGIGGEAGNGRETRTGYGFVVMLGGLPSRGRRGGPGGSRLVTGISYRWMDFDGYSPQQLTFEVGWRLGG